MNERNLQRFCFRALIKNMISCLKIHLVNALSLVYLIATFFFRDDQSHKGEYQPVLYNSADTCVLIIYNIYFMYYIIFMPFKIL